LLPSANLSNLGPSRKRLIQISFPIKSFYLIGPRGEGSFRSGFFRITDALGVCKDSFQKNQIKQKIKSLEDQAAQAAKGRLVRFAQEAYAAPTGFGTNRFGGGFPADSKRAASAVRYRPDV
jgi:hypothetical protein